MKKKRKYNPRVIPDAKRCVKTNRSGERCRNKRHGDLEVCYAHRQMAVKAEKDRLDIEVGKGIVVNARNRARIEWLIENPKYNFTNEDMVIDYLFRLAAQDGGFRMDMDIFGKKWRVHEREARNLSGQAWVLGKRGLKS